MTQTEMTPQLPAADGMPFEKALAELEEIVKRLEQGSVPLEESIVLYERGELLRKQCAALLKQAEARIEKISLSPGGAVTGTQPLDVEA
ncbi:MAG: exodeoxyribonuclease VII small subunit [Methylobacteriaceae bacterium]|jgi:exodeoxyribonuclease VII small subunit|nr:exodeoxyribonuclease VII small subunit [Methylobacteriaceae bacterium]